MEEINFPPDVRKMLFVLIGEMPLQARENLLYASRELYSFYGKNLTKLRDTARDTIQKSRDSLPPATRRFWSRKKPGGPPRTRGCSSASPRPTTRASSPKLHANRVTPEPGPAGCSRHCVS